MQTVPWKERVAEHAGGATFVMPEPEPARARVWFFTRKGGVSEPPHDSLNTSTVVGDEREAVAENLSRVLKRSCGTDRRPGYGRWRGTAWSRWKRPRSRVRATRSLPVRGGVSLVVAVADCVPVALPGEGTVGMVYSGCGTLSGIGGKAARKVDGGAPGSTRVFIGIGPGIRGCCYEDSEELAERLAGRFGQGVVSGRYLSLTGAVRRDLEEAGLEEIQDLDLCPGCRTDLFYAHRKEGPKTDRNLMAVALQ